MKVRELTNAQERSDKQLTRCPIRSGALGRDAANDHCREFRAKADFTTVHY